MKLVVSIVGLVLCTFCANAQNFEGEIIYKNSFVSKLPGLTSERLISMIGNKQDYFIKEGRYKSVTNGSMIGMQIYDNEKNTLYSKKPGLDTLYATDASFNDDNVISFEILKNAEVVLGNSCDALVVKTKTGSTTFFYNNKYKLNAGAYSKHLYGNWAFFASKTGALPLKTIVDNAQFKMENVATEIKPMKLDPSSLRIDPNAPVKKSP